MPLAPVGHHYHSPPWEPVIVACLFSRPGGSDVPTAGTWIHSQLNGRMVGVISMQPGHTNTLQSIRAGHLSPQWWHCTLGELVLLHKNVKKPFCWSHQHCPAITVLSHEHHGLSNHSTLHCLCDLLFRLTSKKTSKLVLVALGCISMIIP